MKEQIVFKHIIHTIIQHQTNNLVMRKILILLFIFCFSNHLLAQIMVGEPYYFCALNGSCYNDNDRKVTFEENEYTNDEIIHLTEQFQNAHPEFEIIEPVSMKYNCHEYNNKSNQ